MLNTILGDVVGAYADLEHGQIFFSRNGVPVPAKFTDLVLSGKCVHTDSLYHYIAWE